MTPTQFQVLVGEFSSRRLLLVNPLPTPLTGHDAPSSSEGSGSDNSFDSNVVMILSVFFCAIICSIGLNAIIRCALRCSIFVASDSSSGPSPIASSVGPTSTGINRKALKNFPVVSYSADLNLHGLDFECVICLSEFIQDEQVRLLPKCNHGFHVRCIDKWLSAHSSCPTCRHCLIETCQKIVLSSQVATSSPPPAHFHVISIPPLKPEGFVRNYRGEGN